MDSFFLFYYIVEYKRLIFLLLINALIIFNNLFTNQV